MLISRNALKHLLAGVDGSDQPAVFMQNIGDQREDGIIVISEKYMVLHGQRLPSVACIITWQIVC